MNYSTEAREFIKDMITAGGIQAIWAMRYPEDAGILHKTDRKGWPYGSEEQSTLKVVKRGRS